MKRLLCILLCLITAVVLAHPTGTWLGYNEETGKYLPVLLNASGAAVVEGIGSVPESYYKSAIDTANEEVSADFDAAAALVTSNYADISSAIASKGVDMTGVKPSEYDTKITEAVELKEREAWFMFDPATKTLYGYNPINGPKDMVIPASINGVAVEIIATSAFQIINAELRMTSAYFPDSVKTIQNQILYGQTLLTSIRLPQNPFFTAIPNNFAWNSRITVLDVPTSVLSIGSQAVYGNPVFAELIAPSVTSIGASAFYLAPLTKITIGANCTITSSAQSTMGNFGVAFEALYNGNGKLAGTYEYIAGTWTKTA